MPKVVDSLVSRPDTHTLWQLKLLLAYYNDTHTRLVSGGNGSAYPKTPLVNADPKTPLVNAEPKTPWVNADPKTPVVNTEPKTPVINSDPKTPVVNSDPKTPLVNAEMCVKIKSHLDHLFDLWFAGKKFEPEFIFLVKQTFVKCQFN